MLVHRIAAAVLCALFFAAPTVPSMAGCHGRKSSAVASCCKNERSCPMHRKTTATDPCFNACQRDTYANAVPVAGFRAILTDAALSIPNPAPADRPAGIECRPLSLVRVPLTPPPRIG